MDYQTIKIDYDAFVAILSIHNPPVNAITPQVIDDLDAAFTELSVRPGVRAVVITSALEKIFVAGADINQFVSWKKADGIAVTRRGHEVYKKIEDFKAPVICAINGLAFGGGLELALTCDIRVIGKRAKVGLPETGLGIVPGYGGTQRLPKLIGPGMAKKLIFSGAPIDAEEAFRIGIAELLTENGECLAEAKKLAEQISTQAPLAISAGKKCVAYAMANPLEDGIDLEIRTVGELAETLDKTEGARAFLEKRPPVFEGK